MVKTRPIIYLFLTLVFWLALIPNKSIAQLSRYDRLYQGTPINPIIETMLNSVSTDSIFSYLDTLVSFYTRHTNSDTTSPVTGIGAARNFIYSKFDQFGGQTNGGVQPGFFLFPATVCGIFSSAHKNVLGTINGTQTPDRIFIVSGHMDGRTHGICDNTSFAPSANDDGSGAVVSIEMARVISQFADDIESTLIIMTVTGEDQGLFGSTAYADWAFANNLRIDGMITNDVVGNITGCVDPACPNGNFITDSTSVRHFSGGPSTSSSRQFTRYMKLKAEQYISEVPWTVNLIPSLDRPGRGGDHRPFYENGYSAARFTEPHEFGDGSGGNGRQHNEFDLIEFVNIPYIARIVKTNLTGFAILAMAPETPSAPLNVQNAGNGTDFILTWLGTNSEPDFTGYRIALRNPDSLFYQQIIPVGNVNQFTLTGLTPEQPIYLCYSALDTSGNESIFSIEVLVTPSNIPATPQGLDATSMPTGIQLTWLPNTELDLDGYLITRTDPTGSSTQFNVNASQTNFFDNSATQHTLYHYTIQARDTDNNLSPPSAAKLGQLATHDMGILLLDASRDESGISPIFPSDEQVDSFYYNILANFNVAAEWDIADSLEIDLNISDADMAIYSTVILHSDVRRPTHKIAEDTVALRKYLENGGQLFISGWQIIESASQILSAIKIFEPGNFVYDILQTDTSENAITDDFRGADPVIPEYHPITVDSVKIPNFGGDLISMEVLRSISGGSNTEVLYTYRSSEIPPSEFHGLPVALRHITASLQIIVIDFPLYYIKQTESQQLITQGLIDLGEITGIKDETDNTAAIPDRFELSQNYPNPFNPVTIIKYGIPVKSNVVLSLYNILGEQVRVIVNEEKEPGIYKIELNAKNLPSGIYFYQLRAGNYFETNKMVLLK